MSTNVAKIHGTAGSIKENWKSFGRRDVYKLHHHQRQYQALIVQEIHHEADNNESF